jgi:hypothetical protein
MVLEHDDGLKTDIAHQVDIPTVRHPDHCFHLVERLSAKEHVVIGTLNDDLVCPAASHPLKDSARLHADVIFLDLQSGKLVRDHSHAPRRPPARLLSHRVNFAGRHLFIARAKGA